MSNCLTAVCEDSLQACYGFYAPCPHSRILFLLGGIYPAQPTSVTVIWFIGFLIVSLKIHIIYIFPYFYKNQFYSLIKTLLVILTW